MKKKIIGLILAGCALLCGCEQKAEETTLPVQTEATSAETTVDVGPYLEEQTALDAEAYGSVLEAYHRAMTEEWTMGQYAEAGLSYMPIYCGGKSDVLFAFQDLDGDGDRELLIGSAVNDETVDRQVFDAYDLVNGQPRQLFCGFERIRYYLCREEEGGWYFAREGSGGAAVSYWTYALYDGAGLSFRNGLVYDADTNPEEPWFQTCDLDGTKAEAIEAELAEHIIAMNDAQKINIHRGFTCQYTFDQLDSE